MRRLILVGLLWTASAHASEALINALAHYGLPPIAQYQPPPQRVYVPVPVPVEPTPPNNTVIITPNGDGSYHVQGANGPHTCLPMGDGSLYCF